MNGIGHAARWMVCTAVVLSTTLPVVAQESGRTKFTSLLNVEALVDNYSRFLSRKYNLDEEQERFTNKLMHDKANAFLSGHRDNLFGLVDRMFDVRTGGEMDPSELVEWGKQVAPLYEEAKRIIVDGNAQFREILNDEQRAIHDQDLRMMEDSFAQTDDQLRRIVAGEMSVEEFRNPRPNARPGAQPRDSEPSQPQVAQPPPPPPPPSGGGGQQPKTQGPVTVAPKPGNLGPVRPNPGADIKGGMAAPVTPAAPTPQRPVVTSGGGGQRPTPVPPQPSTPARPVSRNFEGEWDQYTAQFIQRFNLDPGQRTKAEEILKDCKEQATRYVRTRESQLNDMDQREAKLRQGKQDGESQKQLQKIQQDRNKLLEPLTAIFEKTLKPRLDRLPTGKQRKDAEASGGRPGANPPRNAPAGAGNRHAPGNNPAQPPPPPPPQDDPQQGQPIPPPPPPPPSEPTPDGEPSKPDE